MSSDSYPSSMEAQNGSAYCHDSSHSYSSSYPPYNNIPDAAASQTAYPQYSSNPSSDPSQPQYEDENTTAHSESYAYESHSQSAYAYQHRPIPDQQAGSQSSSSTPQHYSEREYYLQPSPRYSTPEYENVLTIEEEPVETSTATTVDVNQRPRQHRRHPRDQNSAHGHGAQQNGRTRHHTPPPTTRWWSDEQSPEERMRVGLPRWESREQQAQYEQPRRRQDRKDRA